MERRPLIVVGSGPAGTATALYLRARRPDLAREALLLDKARHPREKVCAGGLIPHTLACLRELDVTLDVPRVAVHEGRVDTPPHRVAYEGRDLCHVVRRAELDALLARTCVERGVEIREEEPVRDVVREGEGVRIETDRGAYWAPVVVGADGSGSVVRRRLLEPRDDHTGRAIMCDVPVGATTWSGFSRARYDFSFDGLAHGLRGYAWYFPCLIGGVPHVNVGAYSVDTTGRRLRDAFDRACAAIGAEPVRIKAFPIHWYDRRAPIAAPGVVLAGDAAGVDPLLGEGISYAFEYGRRAAAAVDDAFHRREFAFSGYAVSVHDSWMGVKLRRLGLLSRVLYGATWPLWFHLLARSRRAQDIGLRWYNGVDGWDRAGRRELLRAAWRGDVRVANVGA